MGNIALFPGSFDPFTSGHLNILTRALTFFDEVVVAVGINQAKRGFFTMEQREDIIRQATKDLKGVRIISYDGLTVDICRQLGIRHIVRGVRNMTDFDNEQAVADALQSGRLMAYGADVMAQEPPSATNPLLKCENAYLTPHIAWATQEARQRLMQIAIDNVKAFIEGKPVNTVGG